MKKQIKDYPNYWIYDNGDVLNTNTQKILEGSIGEHGYKYYRLSVNNVKKMFYAHRLVAEHFIPNPDAKPVVNHIDGNKLNNDVSNLEWVTYSENTKHWKNTCNKKRVQTEYYIEDLENEYWKEIENFPNYLISSCGRIRHKIKNNLLHPSITCGYYKVRLSHNGKASDFMVHKLVYSIFNDDYEINKDQVIDHINGNKLDNNINNLRKISLSENVNAAFYETKTNGNVKIVQQFSKDGELIAVYPSAREAARILNLDASTISKVCRGKNKTHGGFVFKYLN